MTWRGAPARPRRRIQRWRTSRRLPPSHLKEFCFQMIIVLCASIFLQLLSVPCIPPRTIRHLHGLPNADRQTRGPGGTRDLSLRNRQTISEETRSSRLIPGQRRASTTNARHAQSTLKEGAHYMKRLSLIALAVALVFAITIWAPAPAAAQTPVQRGRTLDLLFYSSAGTTTLAFGATYPFSFILDGTLGYTSSPGTSTVDLGARYWFPVRPAGLAPYVGAGLRFATTAGFFLGGGATVRVAPEWNGYVGVNWISAGTSTTAFDVGAQYLFSSRVGGVVGLTGSGGTSSLYVGVTLAY